MTAQVTEWSKARVRSARLAYALELILRAGVVLVLIISVVRPLVGPAILGLGTGPYWGGGATVSVMLDPAVVSGADLAFPELPAVMGRGEIHPGDGLEFFPTVGATIAVNVPDFRQSVLLGWVPLLSGLAIIAVMVLTIGILRTLQRGDVFVSSNVRRLYTIAGIVAIGGGLLQALSLWGYFGIVGHPSAERYVVPTWEISWVPLIAGLAVAVGAEIFRQGLALRDETMGPA